MIGVQCVAYVWFQGKGGVVSHRNFMIANVCLMIGQTAQSLDSITKGAFASFTVATFFVFVTGVGVMRRYLIMRKEKEGVYINKIMR